MYWLKSKSPSDRFKFTLVACTLLSLLCLPLQGQSLDESLATADSLFEFRKYTESFKIYQKIHEQKQGSPSMLLKMAFIKEGLDDYPSALYYLNQYYLLTSNERVLQRMDDLAEEHNLQGYEYTDLDFFLSYFYKYQNEVNLAILSIALFLFAFILYRKRKTKERPAFAGILLVLTLGLLFYLVNFGIRYRKGIILESPAYLMSGPSAGSDILAVVDKGHKVSILGTNDVWVKIMWGEQVVYLKENKIRSIAN